MMVYDNSIEKVMNKSFMDNFPNGLQKYVNTLHWRSNPTGYWVKHWEDSKVVSIIMHYTECKLDGVSIICDKKGLIERISYRTLSVSEGEEINFE
jgi:hypothetical protein